MLKEKSNENALTTKDVKGTVKGKNTTEAEAEAEAIVEPALGAVETIHEVEAPNADPDLTLHPKKDLIEHRD